MKGYKTSFKHDMSEAIVQTIDSFLQLNYVDENDKLVMANLFELQIRLKKKMINYQHEYTITFTPAQAIAMRILYTDFITGVHTHLGNRLRQIADEVHKQYFI